MPKSQTEIPLTSLPSPPSIRSLDSISDQEKIKAFDHLYEKCSIAVSKIIRRGEFSDEEDSYSIYEESVEATLGESIFKKLNAWNGVFKAWNSFQKVEQLANQNVIVANIKYLEEVEKYKNDSR